MENRFLIPCEKRNVSLKISESSLKTPFSNLETVFSAQPMSRRFIYLLTPGKLETNWMVMSGKLFTYWMVKSSP